MFGLWPHPPLNHVLIGHTMQAGKDAGVGAGTSGGSGSATSSLRQKLGSILVTLGTRGSVPSRSDDHWRQEQAASLSKNVLKVL